MTFLPGAFLPRIARIALCAVVCASIGCAAPFRAGAPVDVDKRWYGTVYKQDGNIVQWGSMMWGLQNEDGRRAARTMGGGAALVVAGAFATGYGIGGLSNGEGTGYAALVTAGAAALVAGEVLLYSGNARLEAAVRSYNEGLRPSATRATIVPWAAPAAGGHDRCVAAGVAVRF